MEHAERAAIYGAARNGRCLDGCTMYCNLMPCMDCARAIVSTGIRRLVVDELGSGEPAGKYYWEQRESVDELLDEAGVEVVFASPNDC
jgi:dCMP deaminase